LTIRDYRSRTNEAKLDMDKIARTLGAERRGPLTAKGGYFGAIQLAAEVTARLRTPTGGGRPTDPSWTERRLVPLAPATLARLEKLAARLREDGVTVEPLQLAALLLERAAASVEEGAAEEMVRRMATG